MADHYKTLGVGPEADIDSIRDAYRALMRVHHPDRRSGVPASAEMALKLNAAWAVLRSPKSRAAYDRLRAPRAAVPAAVLNAGATRIDAVAPRVYSRQQEAVRAAHSAASLKAASLALAIGVVQLLAFGASG